MLVHSLDGNQDHVVSAKEFRNWLFPQHMNTAMRPGEDNTRDNTEVMDILFNVLRKQFKDDTVSFFKAIDT